MAELNINLNAGIHAELIVDSVDMYSNTSIVVDPITNSYSDYGKLVSYNIQVFSQVGLVALRVLENGKNSRVSSGGQGYMQLKLTVEDELGNTATAIKLINVLP